MTRPAKLRAVTEAHRPRYDPARPLHTIKYAGEVVLGTSCGPTMIVREGGRLEPWDGREGR